ncbi:class I SAM-dependent methyltransferase [Archangium sp.]|jgi:SAM-dependent methyltransferase|uniref:class I SAM-dependent methyltransferase n=1 Tax=Archangium sp. TaxID=1872627 RepID=UPI002ED95C59
MIPLAPGRCPVCPPDAPRTPVAAGRDFEYGTCPDEFSVVRCEPCGTLFLDPRPADEAIASLYPPEYEPYHFDTLPAPVRWGRDLVQRGKVKVVERCAAPGARIVDLGCGGGALLRLLRRHGRPDWSLVGWDFPGPHLDRLAAEGFTVLQGPVEPGRLEDASVDLVILNQVIEHFARPDEVLRVVARVLKPGGTVLIETPDVEGLDARLFRGRYWGGYHFPRHLVLFHRHSLAKLLERTGFEPVATESLPSPAFWVQSFHHAASERAGLRHLTPLFRLRNPLAVAAATAIDLLWMHVAPTSNLRMIGRKLPAPPP